MSQTVHVRLVNVSLVNMHQKKGSVSKVYVALLPSSDFLFADTRGNENVPLVSSSNS